MMKCLNFTPWVSNDSTESKLMPPKTTMLSPTATAQCFCLTSGNAMAPSNIHCLQQTIFTT